MLKILPAELGIRFKILTIKRKTDNFISHGIVFGKFSRIKILMRCGHLTIIDTTHNSNWLY